MKNFALVWSVFKKFSCRFLHGVFDATASLFEGCKVRKTVIYFVIDAALFWDDGADKRDVGCWENLQRRRRRRLEPWYNRRSRILAALAARKVFNAAEGSIWCHKIYGSSWKVDVRMPETVWVPIKAPMGTVKSIQRYRKLFWFILGAADGRLAPFWKIHPFEKKRFSHLGAAGA